MASSSSATIREARRYRVFLSFRGKDTRNGFTSHLHQALSSSQISTFIDNNLRRGDNIFPSLLTTIEESMISVIIFSENYANSSWCLKELVKILQCRELNGQIVIPVFYGVDPSHVRKQIGKFGVAFDKLKERLWEGEMDLNEVRYYLEEAGNISGWNSHDIRPESELIRSIVGDIVKKLNRVALWENMDHRNVLRHLRTDNDRNWVCQFCGHPFPWEVQPETFLHHLTRICKTAPEVEETGKSASLNKRPVGDAFGINVEKIWSWFVEIQQATPT